ncbi:hypothetical protein D5S17_00285 [Pseudonocardiaceae bacterium YIM PH 21723]|nr:hypothetical protein D5S17_00285 [Pseudonocardiaceae bacterium YIM PH 21723]
MLGEGRYRLLSFVGIDARCQAQLWRARDAALGREVALTVFVGSPAESKAGKADKSLERAMQAAGFTHPGMSRVLDVLVFGQGVGETEGVLGMVVAEWTKGTDLVDLVGDGPLPPAAAAQLLQPLAGAVDAAHRAGLVLGTDHPQRIRVTPEGHLRLAFPGPRPETTESDDVKGLGASLYLLLTGRWALEGGPSSLRAAPVGPDGTVVAPRTLRPTVPLELSTVAVRSLSPDSVSETTGGGIRTGAAILQVLQQTGTDETHTNVLARIAPQALAGSQSPPTGPLPTQQLPGGNGAAQQPRPQELWRDEDPTPDGEQKRKLRMGMAALGAATGIVLLWLGAQVVGVVTGSGSGWTGPKLGGDNPSASNQPASNQPQPGAQVGLGAPALIATDDKEHPEKLPLLIDGKSNTKWVSQWFLDPMPTSKPGIGFLIPLKDAGSLSKVTLEGITKDTKVEIRSSDSASPGGIDGTRKLAEGTAGGGTLEIPIDAKDQVKYLVIWIVQQGKNGQGQYQTEIGEIKVFRSASPA